MIRNVDRSSAVVSLGPWYNWFRNQAGGRGGFFPKTLDEIVATVLRAEREKLKLRPVGSSWSYSDVGRPSDYFISLDNVSSVINTNMSSLTGGSSDVSNLIHVQAGIKLYELNQILWSAGKSMLTLGGSQGQSLAGAISTGTHGSDFDRPPLADAVRAMHIVGVGGQEY